MEVPITVWMAAGGVLIIFAAAFILLVVRARKVNITRTVEGQKPNWMKTTPPQETIAATQAEGEGITLYNYDKGEKVAAPFAEQVEDIIRARLRAIPALASIEVDFGTFPDGRLEICVDGKSYSDVSQVPNAKLRQVIRGAIENWDKGQEKLT
jgi:hypothetical protein